jgi:hypothetical protein
MVNIKSVLDTINFHKNFLETDKRVNLPLNIIRLQIIKMTGRRLE